MIISLLAFRRVLRDRPPTCLTGRRGVAASLDPAADISAGFSLHLLFGVCHYVAVTVVLAGRERALGPHESTRIAAPRARRRNARARSNFDYASTHNRPLARRRRRGDEAAVAGAPSHRARRRRHSNGAALPHIQRIAPDPYRLN